MPPPSIPEHIMCAMLRLCTTKAPFTCPEGKLFYQIDGIAMGSPLGVLFAQAFMASVESEVLSDDSIRPFMYCRYIDDILIDVRDNDSLHRLKARLEEVSGLQFTVEYSVDNKISYLDIDIDGSGPGNSYKTKGTLASLDVCSLFTNVPVERTIEILARYAYHNTDMPPPSIPEHIMCAMLRLCTTKAPFTCPEGKLFYQIDGIAMGSPLGVLFAQAFMASVESEVLSDDSIRPFMYCRYIDDILIDVRDNDSLHRLKARLEEVSGLQFTVEYSVDNKISYLDIDIDGSGPGNSYKTKVHRKNTDLGKCLNGASDCPDRYKNSVVKAYVHRALTHCSTWQLVHQELKRVRQILSDNNYPISVIEREIQAALSKRLEQRPPESQGTTHHLFYKNTMSPGYKADEKVLRSIIHRNCKPVKTEDSIKLTIYYKSPSTSSLILKNNMSSDSNPLKQTNVVYHYKCTLGDCALLSHSGYIGNTTTSLTRRITMHLQQGGPLTHTQQHHGEPLTRRLMTQNTKILTRARDKRRLLALEAIYIRELDPSINKQVNARGTLQLFGGPPPGPRRRPCP